MASTRSPRTPRSRDVPPAPTVAPADAAGPTVAPSDAAGPTVAPSDAGAAAGAPAFPRATGSVDAARLITPEQREILHHALEEAARLLRSDGAMAYVIDHESGVLGFADDAGITDDERRAWVRGLQVEPGVGMFGRAVSERRTVMTGDYPADPGFVHFEGADRLVDSLAIHSFLVAPLISGDRLYGAMGTYSSRRDTFDENDAALVRALADHAAAAMANAELIDQLARSQAEVERRADAEHALREIGARITALRDPAEVLQLAVDEAARVLVADGARIDLLNEEDGALYWAYDASTGRRPGLGPIGGSGEAKAGEGISGRAVRELQVVLTGDYLADDRFEHAEAPDAHVRAHAIRSVIAVPLVGDRGPLGTLTVYTGEVDAFGPDDARLLEALANQAAIAMTNAGLIARLAASQEDERRRAGEERALREIAARITAIRDPSDLLQDVVDEAARLLSAERVRIDLLGKGAGRVGYTFLGAGPHIGGAAVDDDGEPYLVGAAGKALQERRTVIVGDYLNDHSFTHVPELDQAVRSDGIRSLVVTPLIAEDTLLGVLQVGSMERDAFGQDQVALAEALAHQAAIAIRNSRLIQALERSAEEIRRRATAEQALREIATRITAIRDPGELLQQVTDAGRELLAGERSQLDILDPATGLIRWTTASGHGPFGGDLPGTREGVAADVGINGAAIESRSVVITGDYLGDERINHLRASDAFVRKAGIKSVVAAPLMSEGAVLGVLKVATIRPDAWDDEDAALMAAFADLVVVAIQNARLIDELGRSRGEISRRADAERSVRQIAANISALRDVGAILQQTVDEARRLLGSDAARIDMLDDDGRTMRWAYASGEDAIRTRSTGFDAEFLVGEGIAGRTVQQGIAFRSGDYLNDERFDHVKRSDDLVRETGYRSVLSAPMLGETGPLGAISVSSERPDHYDDTHTELLQALADQAAIAIQNARLIAELDRSNTEVARRAEAEQSLREIAAQITATREAGTLLQQVVDAAKRLVGGDGAVLDLVEPDGEELRWAYDAGVAHLFSKDELAHLTIPVGVGATGQAVAENRVITASDDPRTMFPDSEINDRFFDATGFRSMIIAPISGEFGPLGALEVYSIRPAAFDEDDAGVIRSLAAQAAIAITNARLIDDLEHSQRQLEARAETERSLRDIAARITSLGDPGEILARVVEESRRLLGSDGAHLTRMSDDRTYLVPVIVAGGMDAETEAWLKDLRFPLGEGINGLAAEQFQPIWTGDYAADPRIPHEPGDTEAAERMGLRAMAAAPLRAPAGEVIGTLAISYAEPRTILPDELDLLQGLADQAAIALANSNLYALLGESEARYRYLVQNSPDLVWSIDSEARFTFVSDTSLRLTGWHADELLGRHFGALVHSSSHDVAEIDWTASFTEEQAAGESELRGRINLLHRDGHPIPAEFIAYASRDEEGRFAGANGSVRDMSERDRLERELRESEERFRFLIENSPDIIFAVDARGRFSYVSDGIRRTLGYEPEELVGREMTSLIEYAPGDTPGARFAMLRDDPTLEMTNRLMLRHADGRTVPFEVSSVGISHDGTFAGIQGAARDISERERLERDLRQSEERYRFLVENSPDIIFSTNAEGVFTYVSESIERVTGFTQEEYTGSHFSEVIDPGSIAAAVERWTALIADPDTRQVMKLDLRRKGGGVVPVEVSSIGTVNDGAFSGIHGATRDITERERLERDLRRQAGELASSQERAHLARELHDSVTQALFSMTLVTRSVELLIDRDPDVAKEKLRSLRDLQREALAEMRALIFELRPGNLETDGLLAALRTHAAALQGRIGLPIVVTSELAERLPLAIEEVLYRIAQEALHNVVKHAAARQVELALDRRGRDVILRIRDDGKGFEAAAVPDGHLGITGMRARADKIRATYEVRSRPGEGTTIEVIVPEAAIVEAGDPVAAPASPSIRGGTG
ncbi:MAG TPA: GAF domain-containing protein [Candidatus Limnocylindrales bacterium]|nr:GAF domain-containing protein [Candidatus Limnocylindrales bacterium]